MDNQEKKRIKGLLFAVVIFGVLTAVIIRLFSGYARIIEEQPRADSPVFSEVMASNETFAAPDGGFYDWVELYNPTAQAMDLSGWGLSDRADDVKFVFPAGSRIGAKGYLVVWCSKAADSDAMAPFGISSGSGETLFLFDADGAAVEELSVPVMEADRSWQRDGSGIWAATLQPTPGEKNILAEPAILPRTDCTVVINELMADGRIGLRDEDGDYSDWAELCNAGETAWDLTGWYLSDDPDTPCKWEIPASALFPADPPAGSSSARGKTAAGMNCTRISPLPKAAAGCI